jgi:hypothetical protein
MIYVSLCSVYPRGLSLDRSTKGQVTVPVPKSQSTTVPKNRTTTTSIREKLVQAQNSNAEARGPCLVKMRGAKVQYRASTSFSLRLHLFPLRCKGARFVPEQRSERTEKKINCRNEQMQARARCRSDARSFLVGLAWVG